jgi:hypothetical protein
MQDNNLDGLERHKCQRENTKTILIHLINIEDDTCLGTLTFFAFQKMMKNRIIINMTDLRFREVNSYGQIVDNYRFFYITYIYYK